VPFVRCRIDRSWRSQERSAEGVWDATQLKTELLSQADQFADGRDAVLGIDHTSLPKKDKRSVGVAAQYALTLGKTANCQTLVSLTLVQSEVQ